MIDRRDPGPLSSERPMLDEWLDYHRATLLMKCDGVSDADLRRRAVPPSSMSLLGLVRHMTDVERHWFRNVLSGQDAPGLYWSDDDFPDGDFDLVDGAEVADDLARFDAECAHARAVSAGLDLDATGTVHDGVVSHRWVLVHMIEEYARHNGHADLLRECIDGVVGD
jgi:hypothetical protein